MPEASMRLYEGLFLFSQNAIAQDFAACVEHLTQILNRAKAQVVVINKWDERRLAYPIEGQKRGTYFLAYFNAPPHMIANIERDCNLSEQVLRCMVIKADHVGETELEIAKKDGDIAAETALRSASAQQAEDQPESTDAPPAQAPVDTKKESTPEPVES